MSKLIGEGEERGIACLQEERLDVELPHEAFCNCYHMLEFKRDKHAQSIRECMEKLTKVEIEKEKAQLEGQQNKRLAFNIDAYHREEIDLLDKALVEKELIILEYNEELLATKAQNRILLAELAKYRESAIMFASSRDVTTLPKKEAVENASLFRDASEFNKSHIACNDMIVDSPPEEEIIMNTFMVEIADIDDKDEEAKTTTIVPYKPITSKWAQLPDIEEGDWKILS